MTVHKTLEGQDKGLERGLPLALPNTKLSAPVLTVGTYPLAQLHLKDSQELTFQDHKAALIRTAKLQKPAYILPSNNSRCLH